MRGQPLAQVGSQRGPCCGEDRGSCGPGSVRAPQEVQGLDLGLLAWDAALGLAVFTGLVAGTPPMRRLPSPPQAPERPGCSGEV